MCGIESSIYLVQQAARGISWLTKKSKDKLAENRETKIEKLMEEDARLHKSGAVSSFLFSYYGLKPEQDANVYRINGKPYHMYVKPEWRVRLRPEDVIAKPLGEETFSWRSGLMQIKVEHLKYLKVVGRNVWDRQTFRLVGVEDQTQGFALRCSVGSYYGFLSTCEVLSDELLGRLGDLPNGQSAMLTNASDSEQRQDLLDNLRRNLQVRQLFAPDVQTLLDYGRRDSKIGIDIFLVLNTSEGAVCWIYHRSKAVGEYPDMNHVAPAGTFQHDARKDLSPRQLQKAFDLKYKAFSEFWEECLEGKDYKSERREDYLPRIALDEMSVGDGGERCFPIRDLMVALENRQAFLYVTGLGIDLLSAKPDVTMLLVINDTAYERKYRRHWNPNWEFPGTGRAEKKESVHICYLNDEVDKIKSLIEPGSCIPAGAMAVDRGFAVLRELRSEGLIDFDVPDW